MRILGIETSCDDCAVAIVDDGTRILSSIIARQKEHERYGGVLPELAARRHLEQIEPTLADALAAAKCTWESIDAIAVTAGPGLIGSLLTGVTFAKALSFALEKPLIAVNHIDAHLYAAQMEKNVDFPCLGLVVSGGHTLLARVCSPIHYEIISTSVDDAIGEAFDKAAKLLGLSYPGGPEIEKIASEGAIRLKPCTVKENPLAFSFSGLKTQVLYALETAPPQELAWAFQEAAVETIMMRVNTIKKDYRQLIVGGGVSANKRLRERLHQCGLEVFLPPFSLCLDNAAMIAGLAFHLKSTLDIQAFSRYI